MMPTNWSQITIKQFIVIYNISRSEIDETEKLIEIAAYLMGKDSSEMDAMPISTLHSLSFLMDIDSLPQKFPKWFLFKGRMYKPMMNIAKEWTSGMYIDVKACLKEPDGTIDNLAKLMAIICLPANWFGVANKYKGDKVAARAKVFEELPVTLAYPMCVFFCNRLESLTKLTRTYLDNKIQENLKIAKDIAKDIANTGDGLLHSTA